VVRPNETMSANTAPLRLVGVVLAGSISAACASQAATPPRVGPSTDGLVLRVDTRGGLLAPGVALTRIPQFSLYADGLIVMEGAQIEIYPGPALPPVFSLRVNAEGLRRIIQAARDAGLGGPDRNYDHPRVADAGTTTFTFVVKGRRHVVSAVALGIETPSDVPASERKARAALLELESRLGNVEGWLPKGSFSAPRPFQYRGLAVIVSTERQGEQLEEPEVAWPLDRTIADLAEPVAGGPTVSCFAVEGKDLARLRPLVKKANELTPWKSDGRTYWLRFRPLLPEESGCPQAEAARRPSCRG
jgi:hypothetical protein